MEIIGPYMTQVRDVAPGPLGFWSPTGFAEIRLSVIPLSGLKIMDCILDSNSNLFLKVMLTLKIMYRI
jgi:hypothetical protein